MSLGEKLVNKRSACFATYSFFKTLAKTITKNPVKEFRRCKCNKNKQDLIKALYSDRVYVQICKILARNSKSLTMGSY